MSEVCAQGIEDCEAVRVDITPIMNRSGLQPRRVAERLKSIPRTKDGGCVSNRRKGEKVDFIFYDKHVAYIQIEMRKRFARYGDVVIPGTEHSFLFIQNPKPDENRFFPKAITACKGC